MSVANTLAAFLETVQPYIPSVNLMTVTPAIPFAGPYPAMIVTEFKQIVSRQFSGLRGQSGYNPNLYAFNYLQATPEELRIPIPTAVAQMRTNIEAFLSLWDNEHNITLHGNVINAGNTIQVDYDRSGHFVNFLGAIYIGCSGVIEIWEPYYADQQV